MQAANQPLISVVMATYNGEKFLAKQLDSLLSQTYPNIEIVICDDASTDGTSLLLASYGAIHNNIRILQNLWQHHAIQKKYPAKCPALSDSFTT